MASGGRDNQKESMRQKGRTGEAQSVKEQRGLEERQTGPKLL